MRMLLAATLLAAAAMPAAAENAADYPSRPIKFISISAAGSGGDVLSRMITDKMAPILKSTFVIENRPGASGAIATEMLAKAAPDGYTIGIGGATTHVLLAASGAKINYDPVKSFAPIGQIGTASILLVAANDFPANNARELVALSKKTPGGLQYASWGNASTGHFCGALLNLRESAGLNHIPYKAVSQILTDLQGGHIKLGMVDMASGSPQVKAGRIKALAACMSKSPSLPDVRSYEEDGIDFEGQRMGALRWALYAPAATPGPILERLSAALKEAVEMPDVKARLLDLGVTAEFMSGPELQATTGRDIGAWKRVGKAANISNE